MDIVSVVERISAIAEQTIGVSANRCLRAIDRHNTCDLCAQACPVGAISFQAEPYLDESKCQGCAACIQVCPSGVFHGEDGAAELFRCLQVMGRTGAIELVCGNHPQPAYGPPGNGVALQTHRCLVNLSPSILLGLVKMGLERISLRLDGCCGCSLEKSCAQIRQSVKNTNALLQQAGATGAAVEIIAAQNPGWAKRPLVDVKNPPMSRRSFFDMLSHSSMRLAGQIVNDPKMPGEVEKQPGRERLRLANALRLYPEIFTPANLPDLSKLFPLYNLQVSQECNACGVCASMCPSGALRLISDELGDDKPSKYEITFSPLKCVGCGICVDYCEASAVSLADASDTQLMNDLTLALKEREVMRGELLRCERCHVSFARKPQNQPMRTLELCPLCEFRRSQPFGFALPRRAMLKNAV